MTLTIKKIIKILQKDDIELKSAACKILGELKPKDKKTYNTLIETLKYNNITIRKNTIEALGKVGNPDAIREITIYLNKPELLKTTIDAIVNIGSKAVKNLEKIYEKENIEFKKSVVEIVLRLRDKNSIRLLFKIINNGEPLLLEWISEIIGRYSTEFNIKEKKIFKKFLLKNIKKVMHSINELILVIYIKLIGVVQATETFPYLIKFMDESMPPRVRRNAIFSLMVLPFKKNYETKLIKLLLPLLEDKDYPNIVWNVLKILQRYELPKKAEPYMIKLLKTSPHRGVKKFAINYLSKQKSVEAINSVIDAMWEQDKELRSEALYGIKLSPLSVDVVVKRMDKDIDDERIETYIDILKTNMSSLDKDHIAKIKTYLCRASEKAKKNAKSIFLLLKQLEPDKLRDFILERYYKVKNNPNLSIPEGYIRLLYDSEFINEEIKLELGCILLKKHPKKIPEEEKIEEDEMLAIFRELIANINFAIVKNMKAQKGFLSKEDYYFVGYYFSEKLGREKAFGGEMLRFIMSDYPRNPFSKKAKEKMINEKIPLKL
ncbi:MAG: HEAT repeat domain-containing protein [Candidatus Hydrogenedentota bacterium]